MTDQEHVNAIRAAQKALNAAMKAAITDGLEVSVDDQSMDENTVAKTPPVARVHVYITRHL